MNLWVKNGQRRCHSFCLVPSFPQEIKLLFSGATSTLAVPSGVQPPICGRFCWASLKSNPWLTGKNSSKSQPENPLKEKNKDMSSTGQFWRQTKSGAEAGKQPQAESGGCCCNLSQEKVNVPIAKSLGKTRGVRKAGKANPYKQPFRPSPKATPQQAHGVWCFEQACTWPKN